MYFTVPFPFLLLFAALIRGVTLEGASLGISFYLKPNITMLGDPQVTTIFKLAYDNLSDNLSNNIFFLQVWVKAIEQVCFSFAVGWGNIATLASHNMLHYNFYRWVQCKPTYFVLIR